MVKRNPLHEGARKRSRKSLGVGAKLPGKGSTASGKDNYEKERGVWMPQPAIASRAQNAGPMR